MNIVNVMMTLEKSEQYKKRDSSRISRVEPRNLFRPYRSRSFFDFRRKLWKRNN